MLKIFEFILNIFAKKKFYYFLLRYDTSIGIASESIRLALIRSKIENKRVTFLKCKVPFGKFFFKNNYPKKIYSIIQSDAIRSEFIFVEILISYYYGIKFLLISIFMSVLNMRKMLYSQYMYGHENIYFPESFLSEFNNTSQLLRVGRSVIDFPLVELSNKSKKSCKEDMLKLGLVDCWYVCLHIRSSYFYNDNAHYRNASIENYYKAIDLIIANGGKVVRMGDMVEDFITKPRKDFIDYANSSLKSETMDLYLIQNCKFYFGTQSGIIDTALLFKKPVLSVNSIHFAIPGSGAYDITIYKKIYDKNLKRFLSFREAMFLYGYFLSASFEEFSNDYEWVENTDQEIYDATKEIMHKIESLRIYKTKNQKTVQKILKQNASKYNFAYDLAHIQALFSRVIIGEKYIESWTNGKF